MNLRSYINLKLFGLREMEQEYRGTRNNWENFRIYWHIVSRIKEMPNLKSKLFGCSQQNALCSCFPWYFQPLVWWTDIDILFQLLINFNFFRRLDWKKRQLLGYLYSSSFTCMYTPIWHLGIYLPNHHIISQIRSSMF